MDGNYMKKTVTLCVKKNKHSKGVSKAFTLAETLITLVVIGVVAAMTVPAVKNHTEEVRYVAQVKKAYADISNATGALETKYGDCRFWSFGTAGDWDQNSQVVDWYKTAMNATPTINYTAGQFGGSPVSFTTADGMAWSLHPGGYSTGGVALVDVNGVEGPNVTGVDIHGFRIGKSNADGESGVFPLGDGVNDTNTDWACTPYVLNHGKMPWLSGGDPSCKSYYKK